MDRADSARAMQCWNEKHTHIVIFCFVRLSGSSNDRGSTCTSTNNIFTATYQQLSRRSMQLSRLLSGPRAASTAAAGPQEFRGTSRWPRITLLACFAPAGPNWHAMSEEALVGKFLKTSTKSAATVWSSSRSDTKHNVNGNRLGTRH